jgi:uncharacterized protein YecE (DUF72 family)
VPSIERSPQELKSVHIGCSGWHYRHWRGVLYPEGLAQSHWLERYAELFATVENNSAFYRLPSEEAVEGWVSQTPPGFIFAVKVSRYITHVKRLQDVASARRRLDCVLRPMTGAHRLGPLLWQLPESFQRDDERLASALESIDDRRKNAFEFRHSSWFCEPVYELLREHGAGLVVGDHPERPFQTRELTAPFVYLRLHIGRGPNGSYTRRQIDEWAKQVQRWRESNEVFVYFNNDGHGCAVRDALALERALDLPVPRRDLE